MPSPGSNVQSRRSHTKSRKGCRTCKRRHIRCDENFPQCRNCTKHNVRCDYMDAPLDGDCPSPQGIPDLNITPQIQQELDNWKRTGIYPFPTLRITHQPSPANYSTEDLRLIHHISMIAQQMQAAEPIKHAIWTKRVPLFLRIASENVFVMHSLLGLSASHLSWLRPCTPTQQLAYQHRGVAFKGLHDAIGNFSRRNSDAVLAASMLLSWQVTDCRSWVSLMMGTETVIEAMQEWKYDSEFKDFMDERETYSGSSSCAAPVSDPDRDHYVLKHVYGCLMRLTPFFVGKEHERKSLNELLGFIQELQSAVPIRNADDQFELLYPLRNWIFFLPLELLRHGKQDPGIMVLFAHFYGVALAVEPLFPAVGPAYFGSMAIGPIEDIHQTLMNMQVTARRGDDMSWAVGLMDFPLEMIGEFRRRMDWKRAADISSPRIKVEPNVLHAHGGGGGGPSLSSSTHVSLLSALNGFDWSAFENMEMLDAPLLDAPFLDGPGTPSSAGSDLHGALAAASGFGR